MRKMVFICVAVFLTGYVIGEAIASLEPASQDKKKHARLSPFEAVRWKDSMPEVQVTGVWYELLAINDVAAKDIVAFIKKREGAALLQKRFGEDLVEMMSKMGHELGEKVDLKVRDKDGKTQTLKDVPNTHENRQKILKAGQKED